MRRRRLSVVDGRPRLKADSLRLWHLVAVGLAFQSLALVVYLNVGFIEQTAEGPRYHVPENWFLTIPANGPGRG